jgi:hypothetical protein
MSPAWFASARVFGSLLSLVALAPVVGCGAQQEAPTVSRSVPLPASAPSGASSPAQGSQNGDTEPATPLARMQHPVAYVPGYLRGKKVNKPAQDHTPGARVAAFPESPASRRLHDSQVEYLRQWEAMQPNLAGLSEQEQQQRRGDLKRAVVGY